RAVRTAQPVVVPTGAAAAVAAVLRPGTARELIAALAPESVALFPLHARGRTLGLLSLYNGATRGAPTAADLSTAGEVAARAGLALDNVRLYSQQRMLAEELQRALLTAPPQPDHLQIVVRYEAAVEAAQVGGDWYDAFLQPDGATVLVIGDVVGHDTAAAAAMGQLRSLLRGIAAHTGVGPAGILRGVDEVLQTLQIETTATAVVARLEQSGDERSRGLTRLRWSNAGHPPPMVINPDGTVAVLAGPDADLLLGIDPTSRRIESEVALDRGATVLLYTDGLVERRGQSLDDGLMRLRALLVDIAALPLEELCDEILARMLPERRDDDVALVAVRLHRQDRPRPEEAGPNNVPDNVPEDD
ncbi:MAG: GAF domain-containing SpoIIE family protein phosphatase, partial [Mycobacteriales bacterium]